MSETMTTWNEKKKLVRESGLTVWELRQIINEIIVDNQVEEDEALQAEIEAYEEEAKADAYLAREA